MARPKAFDRTQALQRAIKLFADHGYEGTSTDMLLQTMGISRQSMYDTFGTKRELYLLSLKTYNSQNAGRILCDLETGGDAVTILGHVFRASVERSIDYPGSACLTTNSICEFGTRDEEIRRAGTSDQVHIAKTFEDLIRSGQADGTIRADIAPLTAADFCLASLTTWRIIARAGMDREKIFDMIDLLLRAIRNPG